MDLAQQVVAFETGMTDLPGRSLSLIILAAIANVTVPPDDLIDPFVVYNKLTFDQLQQLTPNMHWTSYLKGMGLNFKLNNVLVDAPAFLGNLSIVIGKYTDSWEAYLRYEAAC